MINVPNAPYSLFNRVVYHLHDYEQLKQIKRIQNEIIRVVFVISESEMTGFNPKFAGHDPIAGYKCPNCGTEMNEEIFKGRCEK